MILLKIGEVAKRAKVSIRSLHHYDEIGLLKPSGVSASGHRLYKDADIEKLQQIISLKSIGLPLSEIAKCLDRTSLQGALQLQKEAVIDKMADLKRIEKTLEILLEKLELNQNLDSKELLKFIYEVRKMEEMYTPEQLKKLQARLAKYPEEVKKVEAEWPILFGKFEAAMKQGLSAEEDEVQKLAEKAQHFIDLFTGGDKGIEANLDKFHEKNQENALQTWGVKKEVFEFADKARQIFKKRSSQN
jgi:DNA-binding transcriptional MerR regulator